MNCEWTTGCKKVATAYIVAGCLGKHIYENFFCQIHLERYKQGGHCSCGEYLAEYFYKHIDGAHWHIETTQGSWNCDASSSKREMP